MEFAAFQCVPIASRPFSGTTTWLAYSKLLVHQDPQGLLSSWSVLSMCWCMGLFLLRDRTLHFSFLNFISFLLAHLSSLSRFPGMAPKPSGVSATPPGIVSSANLLMVQSTTLSGSLMKNKQILKCFYPLEAHCLI